MDAAVPNSASGTVRPGITVAGTLSRKTKITSTTAAMVISSVRSTSCTEARMFSVRSTSTFTDTVGGIAAESRGNSALMRSTVSITLAPGCLCTNRITALPPCATPSADAAAPG